MESDSQEQLSSVIIELNSLIETNQETMEAMGQNFQIIDENDKDNNYKRIIKSLLKENFHLKKIFKRVCRRITKVEKEEWILKQFRDNYRKISNQFNNQYASQLEECMEKINSLEEEIIELEAKKKGKKSKSARDKIFSNECDEAFVILSSKYDNSTKELMQKNIEFHQVKRNNINLRKENKALRAELKKLDYLVDLNHFGRKAQNKVKYTNEMDSMTNTSTMQSFDGESMNWGDLMTSKVMTTMNNGEKDNHLKKFPELKLDLQGFPGVKIEGDAKVESSKATLQQQEANLETVIEMDQKGKIMDFLKSKMAREFSEMRLNNEYLVKALKSSYSKISHLKRSNQRLEEKVKEKFFYAQDLAYKVPIKIESKAKIAKDKMTRMSFRESKAYLKSISKDLEEFFTELIKNVLNPMKGYLYVPPNNTNLPIRIKRSASYH